MNELDKANERTEALRHGCPAKNIVAPECFAEAVIRPRTLKEHKKTLKIIEDIQAVFPQVSLKLKMVLEPLEGKNQGGGFTEAYFFRGKGRKVEIVGAGDLHVAHSPEEYVPIVELEALPEKIVEWVKQVKMDPAGGGTNADKINRVIQF